MRKLALDDDILLNIEKPARYIGHEVNSVMKDKNAVEEAMFGRQIHWQSYLYSFLFTVAFSLFVNWVMFYKLKKIDMVESLKSVE